MSEYRGHAITTCLILVLDFLLKWLIILIRMIIPEILITSKTNIGKDHVANLDVQRRQPLTSSGTAAAEQVSRSGGDPNGKPLPPVQCVTWSPPRRRRRRLRQSEGRGKVAKVSWQFWERSYSSIYIHNILNRFPLQRLIFSTSLSQYFKLS